MTPAQLLDLETITGSNDLVQSICQCFYISTAISPLLMFLPKKHGIEYYRKDALVAFLIRILIASEILLLQFSMSLGNKKPAFLSYTEKSVWTVILRISCGHPPHQELQSFIDSYIFPIIYTY